MFLRSPRVLSSADFYSSGTLASSWPSHWLPPFSFSCELWSLQLGRAEGRQPVPKVWHNHWEWLFHSAGAAKSSPYTKTQSGQVVWHWRSCWCSERFRTGSGCKAGSPLACSALCPGEREGNNAGRLKYVREQQQSGMYCTLWSIYLVGHAFSTLLLYLGHL